MKKRERRPMDLRRAHRYCRNLACACGVLEVIIYVFTDGFSWFFLALFLPFAILSLIAYKLDDRYVRCPFCYHPLSDSGPGEVPELGRFCPHCGEEIPR